MKSSLTAKFCDSAKPVRCQTNERRSRAGHEAGLLHEWNKQALLLSTPEKWADFPLIQYG